MSVGSVGSVVIIPAYCDCVLMCPELPVLLSINPFTSASKATNLYSVELPSYSKKSPLATVSTLSTSVSPAILVAPPPPPISLKSASVPVPAGIV